MKITRKEGLRKIKIEHNKKLFYIILILLVLFIGLIIAVKIMKNNQHSNIDLNQTSLANPASVYCEQQGGRVDIRTDEGGNQYGICILKNGTECDEWKYYREEC